MSVLLDTNVLLRGAEPTHAFHGVAKQSMAALLQRGETLCIVPQILYEYWVVATRPLEQNGLGFSTPTAEMELNEFQSQFLLLEDNETVFKEWKSLVVQYDVKGKPAHDARLVAAMKVHQIEKVLTFNDPDFKRFPHIAVLTPQVVASS